MHYALCLGLFMPLLGFLVLLAASHKVTRNLAGIIGCSTIFISLINFIGILITFTAYKSPIQTFTLFQWIHFNQINADFSLHLDPLAIVMSLIITGVGFLIHVYSMGYMDHEKDFARFFACLNFFVFAMLLLVLANNLLLLFVGWEGVGLASYLLIGFWYHLPAASAAATKAFVVNRVGDLGLLLGLILTIYVFGTTDAAQINEHAAKAFSIGAPLLTVITMLYFFGATGKSAQIPLQTWLPDAMAGPTPVSALIHAATMVTAGVYLVVRMNDLFVLTPITMMVMGFIGAITALYASLCALGQTDLKRVLAYSTVSQLGLMFLACGAGAFYAAMFHLTTHAFIKATLFLSAGNVVHMLHGTTEMARMGGLAKVFTKTHWFFLIGALSLSGIPPLAAFFSKDLILENEYLSGFETLFYIALAASIMTAIYMTRAYFMTFRGKCNLTPEELANTKEAPTIMVAPVALLTFFSIVGGFLGFSIGKIPILEGFLSGVGVTKIERELTTSFVISPESIMAIAGAFLGVGISAVVYSKYADRLGNTLSILKKSFYVDELYDLVLVKPLKGIATFIAKIFEPKVFEGSIAAVGDATHKIAGIMQSLQNGQIRSYVAWMAAGAVLLIVFYAF